jgi:hypothetical protein
MITNLQQLFLDDINAAFSAFVANCFLEALPPVDFFAICFVLTIIKVLLF